MAIIPIPSPSNPEIIRRLFRDNEHAITLLLSYNFLPTRSRVRRLADAISVPGRPDREMQSILSIRRRFFPPSGAVAMTRTQTSPIRLALVLEPDASSRRGIGSSLNDPIHPRYIILY